MTKDEEENLTDKSHGLSEAKVKTRTVIAFSTIGFLVDFFFFINLSSSQDILQGTDIPTSFVFLSSTGPAWLSTVVYPYVFQSIPVSVASCGIFVLSVAGMMITSLVQEPRIKLIGVCLVSFGYGSGDTVFCPLSALYGKATVDSYAVGSGIATLLAPLSYIGLTMLACLSPEVSHLLITVLWILFPIAYIGMEDRSNTRSNPTSYKEVPYSPIESDRYNDELQSKLFCIDMLSLFWKTQVSFIALFLSNFSKQLLMAGVVTTLAFTNISLAPRNQYLIYMLALGFGDLSGRSYLALLSLCGIEHKFTIQKTWILAFFNVSFLILMVLVSWFRLFSNFYAVFAVVLINSMLSGAVCVNSFHNAGEGLTVSKTRFCRALLTWALWSANTSVSLLGLDTEVRLRRKCLAFFPEVLCYTRSLTR